MKYTILNITNIKKTKNTYIYTIDLTYIKKLKNDKSFN